MTATIGFLVHPDEDRLLDRATATARQCGYEVWTAARDPAITVAQHIDGCALLVTVGGDGTFLLGARLAAKAGVPVLGVNRGRLGFLTTTEIGDLPAALVAFHEGVAEVKPRAMLQANWDDRTALALNDVVVKSPGVSVVRLRVDSDGVLLGEFDADGIVVATATGSTAYALSAGGPLVDPRVRANIVVPLAPHAVISRGIVLPDSEVLGILVQRGPVVFAADGQACCELAAGAVVTITPGPDLRMLMLPQSPPFLHRLRQKLRFGQPLKALDHDLAPGEDAHGSA